MDDPGSRIMELEIRFTHQASLLEELNVELTSANRRIDLLERRLAAMQEVVVTLGPELTESPDE